MEDSILIVQCQSGHLYGDLIACARYRVDDERDKVVNSLSDENGRTHVLFIIHLPRGERTEDGSESSFVGFQGGKWLSAHIDDLSTTALTVEAALTTPISKLFYNPESLSPSDQQCCRLYDCIQATVAKLLVDCEKFNKGGVRTVNILLQYISSFPEFPIGKRCSLSVTAPLYCCH